MHTTLLKLSVFILLIVSEASGQHFISLGYQHGYNVPAYERSPETNRTSPFFHLTYGKRTHNDGGILDQYYGGPDIHYHLFYQNLGNDDVMGSALGFVPELKFRLRKGRKSAWFGGGGLGAAWVSQPYDKNDNPTNQALGTPWNIYAQAGIEYQYQMDSSWYFGAELSVHHLSNSFFSFPNLGVNIPSFGVKIVKELRRYEKGSKLAFSPKIFKTQWRPFLRFVYGITERAFDGPKFAVVGGGLGVRKRLAPHRTVLLGGEFMFDKSSYYFVSRASGGDEEKARKQARRMLLFAGHEYHFGYASFLTEAGIYISEQFNRQSIISAKAGFNFYPFHQFFHYKHQFSVGVYIRAYFLRADFFEINVNYRL